MRFKKLVFLLLAFLFLVSCFKLSSNKDIKVVNIGYQKGGILSYLKYSKILDDDLQSKNIKVSWIEFPSGPPMLEALNAKSIDFADTGETPPIFVQSSGKEVIYLATTGNVASGEGIVIPHDSHIKNVKDLKGKKIAVTKGSSAQNTLISILEKEGIAISDIKSVYLQPFDARFAFESGRIDAWCVWDPYFSAAKLQLNAKVLKDSTFVDQVKPNFYLTSENFIQEHEDIIEIILNSIAKIDKRSKENPQEFSKVIAKLTSLPEEVTDLIVSHWDFDVNLIKMEDIDRQQQVADLFFKLNLIPKHINVKDYVWRPKDFQIQK